MELLEPKNFFDLATILIGVFGGAIAIVGVFISLETLRIAGEALKGWEKRKDLILTLKGMQTP